MARTREIALPWTQQPQEAVRPHPHWLARGMVYADTLGPWAGDAVSGLPDTTTYIGGVAASQLGLGVRLVGYSGQYVQTRLTTNPLRRTYVISALRSGDSGTPFGRILDRAATATAIYTNDTDSRIEFVRSYSGARGVWGVTKPTDDTIYTIGVSIDASSASNDPLMAVDGVLRTVTELEPPSGSADTSGSDPWYVGNRQDGLREFAGLLANLLVFDEALTADELRALTANPHQAYAPRRILVPVYGAAPSGVPDITAVVAENILATSADYRVTLDFA